MNKINHYTKGLLLAFVAMAGIALTSCKDQPDAYEVTDGTPTVDYIRNLSTEIKSSRDADDMHYTNGELVEEASPQSTLALIGSNLRSVVRVFFNDKEAVLNNSYITDNVLIVDVPKGVPVDVTDKIYLYNQDGAVTSVDFKVVIPPAEINTMSCEYAEPGTIAKVIGDYIVDNDNVPLEVYFKNAADQNIAAEIIEVAKDNTYVTVRIPDNAVEGPITMKTLYGTSVSAFYYRDSRGMLFDFEDPSVGGTGLGRGGNAWHDRPIVEDENSIAGHYMIIGDGETPQKAEGGWDDKNYSFEYWCGDWNTPQTYPAGQGIRLFDLGTVDFTKPENLILKFELCIPSTNPWMTGGLQMFFSSTKYVSLGGASPDVFGQEVKAANNIYFRDAAALGEDDYFKNLSELPRAIYRPWSTSSTGSFDTGGEWITVFVPIASSFVYGYNGGSVPFTLTEKDFANFQMILIGGGEKASTPLFYIDNIRVIPNK